MHMGSSISHNSVLRLVMPSCSKSSAGLGAVQESSPAPCPGVLAFIKPGRGGSGILAPPHPLSISHRQSFILGKEKGRRISGTQASTHPPNFGHSFYERHSNAPSFQNPAVMSWSMREGRRE